MEQNDSTRTQQLPIEIISPARQQARDQFNADTLRELALSIKRAGMIQPIVVRPKNEGYELIAGERRWRAAQMLGMAQVPAVIRSDVDDGEAGILGLVENLQREALSPVETAQGLAYLVKDKQLTHDQAASRIGKSRVYVTNYLRLLHLCDSVQQLVDERVLSLGHAKVLAGMPKSVQKILAGKAAQNGWSVRQLEKRYEREGRTPKGDKAQDNQELARIEGLLGDILGNRVHIRYVREKGAGELRIVFHDLEEFEGLLQRLGCTNIADD